MCTINEISKRIIVKEECYREKSRMSDGALFSTEYQHYS